MASRSRSPARGNDASGAPRTPRQPRRLFARSFSDEIMDAVGENLLAEADSGDNFALVSGTDDDDFVRGLECLDTYEKQLVCLNAAMIKKTDHWSHVDRFRKDLDDLVLQMTIVVSDLQAALSSPEVIAMPTEALGQHQALSDRAKELLDFYEAMNRNSNLDTGDVINIAD